MLQCPACNTENPRVALFCLGCGRGLTESLATPEPPPTKVVEIITCSRCGVSSPPEYSYCIECGESLSAGADSGEGPHRRAEVVATTRHVAEVRVVRILSTGDGESYPVDPELLIGREQGGLCVPEDAYLSARHAVVERNGGQYILRDLDSANGTFIRIRDEVELQPGDHVMMGRQVFRFVV